jgi:hypothetical protein
MAVKFRLKEVGVSFIAVMDADELLLAVVDELLHAAARRPSAQTPAVMTNFGVLCLKETTLFIETRYGKRPTGGRAAGRRSQRTGLFTADTKAALINGSSTSDNAR